MVLAVHRTDRAVLEWECARLINEFALLNDAREYERLSSLFREDGVFTRPSDPDNPVKGRQAILEHFRGRPPRFTRHLITNVVVDLQAPDLAHARSYVLIYSSASALPEGQAVRRADPVQSIAGFEDVIVREDDQWRFASRRGFLMLTSA